MTDLIKSPGWWLHNIIDFPGEFPDQEIANLAGQYKFGHLAIKLVDGYAVYQNARALVSALWNLDHKVEVWGWAFVYPYASGGQYEMRQIDAILQAIQNYALDGFIINAEASWKDGDKSRQAETLMSAIKNKYPDMPLALSSYRYPSYHREFPWGSFLAFSDIMMPQVYWMGAQNSAWQLNKTLDEFATLYEGIDNDPPIVPTGAAFGEHSWVATPESIKEFISECKRLSLHYNLWELDEAYEDHPELFRAWIEAEQLDDDEDDGPDIGPYPVEECLARFRVINDLGLLVRDFPSVYTGERLGKLSKGETITAIDMIVGPDNVWIEHVYKNQLGYSALLYGGRQYLEYVNL